MTETTILDERAVSEIEVSGLDTAARLSHQEDTSMTKNYDDFRAGMLRAAEMARDEFKRAPEAAKGHDCVYMGGYEDACDHLSVVIAQAAVIDSVRIAGSQPDWQYHIALLLPDGAVEDQALLKIYQVVEHELGSLQSQLEQLRAENESLKAVWCLCGHAKTSHGFFSDHDECYECDQASPDLCCEWRPVARVLADSA